MSYSAFRKGGLLLANDLQPFETKFALSCFDGLATAIRTYPAGLLSPFDTFHFIFLAAINAKLFCGAPSSPQRTATKVWPETQLSRHEYLIPGSARCLNKLDCLADPHFYTPRRLCLFFWTLNSGTLVHYSRGA